MMNATNPKQGIRYDSGHGDQRIAPQIKTPVISSDLKDWLKPRLLVSAPQVSGCLLGICRPIICNSEQPLIHQ